MRPVMKFYAIFAIKKAVSTDRKEICMKNKPTAKDDIKASEMTTKILTNVKMKTAVERQNWLNIAFEDNVNRERPEDKVWQNPYHDIWIAFSNGNSMGRGICLFGLETFDSSIGYLTRLFLMADDIMGGGPTQRVLYDFVKYGTSSIFNDLQLEKLYFKAKNLNVWGKTDKIIWNFKEYAHISLYEAPEYEEFYVVNPHSKNQMSKKGQRMSEKIKSAITILEEQELADGSELILRAKLLISVGHSTRLKSLLSGFTLGLGWLVANEHGLVFIMVNQREELLEDLTPIAKSSIQSIAIKKGLMIYQLKIVLDDSVVLTFKVWKKPLYQPQQAELFQAFLKMYADKIRNN